MGKQLPRFRQSYIKLSRRENTIVGKFSTVTKHAFFGRKCPTGPVFTKWKTNTRTKVHPVVRNNYCGIPVARQKPRYWDPTYRTHLTYIARQVIVDRPDDGDTAGTCSLVLLT
jgi:hypothetical protein